MRRIKSFAIIQFCILCFTKGFLTPSYAASSDVPVTLNIKKENAPIVETIPEVQTGDDTMIWPAIVIMAVALLILLLVRKHKRK